MILSSLVVPHILNDFCNLRVLKLRCPKGQEGEAIREEGGVECTCVYCVNGGDQCWTGEHSSLKTVEGKQVPSAGHIWPMSPRVYNFCFSFQATV